MSPKKKTETKPTAHVHTHEYPPAAWVDQYFKILDGTRDAMLRICIQLGITARIYGKTGIKSRLPGQPENLAPPEIDGVNNRLKFTDGSTWSIRRLLVSLLGEEGVEPYLREKMRVGQPQLQRFFCFEAGDEADPYRSVTADPHEALAELHVPDGSKIRGVVVDCPPDLNLAKQLCGQAATRKRFNWHPDVPLDRDGKLADVRWHQTWLTPLEQLLLKEQQGIERVIKLRRARRESVMHQAKTEWT